MVLLLHVASSLRSVEVRALVGEDECFEREDFGQTQLLEHVEAVPLQLTIIAQSIFESTFVEEPMFVPDLSQLLEIDEEAAQVNRVRTVVLVQIVKASAVEVSTGPNCGVDESKYDLFLLQLSLDSVHFLALHAFRAHFLGG